MLENKKGTKMIWTIIEIVLIIVVIIAVIFFIFGSNILSWLKDVLPFGK